VDVAEKANQELTNKVNTEIRKSKGNKTNEG
jgi:hypothetical protein